MKRHALALALVLTASAASVSAADTDGAYWSQRPETCRNFVRFIAANERKTEMIAVRNWVAGYLSAYNRQTPQTYDITGLSDFEQVLRRVERFCKDNQFADVGEAMAAITEELHATRHQTKRQAGR
jgi:hypothetical protein